ncbi:MAG: bifunctional UDP-N-acetylglucosamine diphosphorylase/glucosamine-1-phosphate N-acetyltransferase GlmU [Anaerolineales bacterium]|nr:bifunctional UDP-N-acetylglucosamine diphosphorylase/glucosamine-1-phosphate N-acetyltransferase GlmU [Anaerolineales bacterium]
MVTDVVILAAGKGKRMCSDIPKPLHSLMGKPIIHYALMSTAPLVKNNPVVILGHGAEQIRQALGENLRYVEQGELLGTGHAVSQAESLLKGQSDLVLVTYVDMPLVRTRTLQQLIDTQKSNSGPMTLLTVHDEDPRGFGRITRNSDGNIQAIVEEADASAEQLKITELNAGMCCFDADWLWANLKKLPLSPTGEYYLTDLVALAKNQDLYIEAVPAEDPEELIGINTRVHLAEAGKILRRRINRELMLSGVSLVDPDTAYIEPDVIIGQDTVILPNTFLQGGTSIGTNCLIGPDTRIFKSQIGDFCEIEYSVIEESKVENGVDIGPFSHLRKGAHIGPGVHIGNFGEIKDSYLGEGTKVGHFSYLGNAQIGKDVNIGAGTITCNYDGKKKHQTVIKDGVFVGSDSMLVAPLELGENSSTGAGSVVTKDVPPDTVVAGIPARNIAKKKKD